MERYLVLEDGTVFSGEAFGFEGQTTGEVVFTTGAPKSKLAVVLPVEYTIRQKPSHYL